MTLSSAITSLKNAINGLITTHANITGNSSTKGHVQSSTQAGLADKSGGAAGTDNGIYARADHQHVLSDAYATSNHTHSDYLTSSDISGKLDISQTSYKGKNVVVDGTSGNITFENKPTIPSASTSTPSADVSGGAIGSGTTWAKADHQHPLSSAYATASHTHSVEDITDFEGGSFDDTALESFVNAVVEELDSDDGNSLNNINNAVNYINE